MAAETVTKTLDRTAILKRIDLITQELYELRRMVEGSPSLPVGITALLLGSLGSEPLENYDYDLDWKRFLER